MTDGAPKEISRLMASCRKQGATVTMTGSGHFKVVFKDAAAVFVSQTPRSVHNCVRNATKDLRKAGLDV